MKHVEVEQKFHLKNHAELRELLKKAGAKKLDTQHQIDTYYNAPHRDFLAEPIVNEWLRLREQQGDKAFINYKRWLPLDAKIKTHCDEFESELSDVEAVRKLLAVLGFVQLIVVDKRRETWYFDEIEIALDAVKDLGDFAEFEYKGAAESVAAAQEQIEKVIAALDAELGERSHVGYPYMLLEKWQANTRNN